MTTSPGTLSIVDGRPRLCFERRFAHPIEKVWRAISEPDGLRHWFPADVEIDPVAGGKMRFEFRDQEGPTLEGEVLEIEPPRLLTFRWHEDVLRFELAADGAGCVLTFSCALGETDLGPPMEGGRPARDGAGWHICLDALQRAVAGEPAPSEDPDWKAVHAEYVKRFT